jgi:hypothetical protein
MSLLSRQRRTCEELAREARQDRADVEAARAELLRRVRRDAASPAGLFVFFAAGLVAGSVLSAGRSKDEESASGERVPARRGVRAMTLGLQVLRVLEALGRL